MAQHDTFTDFLFVLNSLKKVLGFIEVKKTSISTRLADQTNPTAQALREAQIALLNGNDETIPFILTNSITWSIGVAEKHPEAKVGMKSIHLSVNH